MRRQQTFDETLRRAYDRTGTVDKGAVKHEDMSHVGHNAKGSFDHEETERVEFMTESLIRRAVGVLRGPVGGVSELTLVPSVKERAKIHRIAELHCVPRLKILNLSGHAIKKMENLHELKYLRELNLAGNKIRSIENFETLTYLERLDVTANVIEVVPSQLDTLQHLYSVRLSKNKIRNVREFGNLSGLPNLQSLTIDGNPCMRSTNARTFVVYKLRYLDTLDGTSVTLQEKSDAKSLFQNNEIDELQKLLEIEKERSDTAARTAKRLQDEITKVKNMTRGALEDLSRREHTFADELEAKNDLLEKKSHALAKAREVVSGLEQRLVFSRIDESFVGNAALHSNLYTSSTFVGPVHSPFAEPAHSATLRGDDLEVGENDETLEYPPKWRLAERLEENCLPAGLAKILVDHPANVYGGKKLPLCPRRCRRRLESRKIQV